MIELLREKSKFGFPTRSNTNRFIQSQRQARSLKFWIKVEVRFTIRVMKKCANELCSYCTADLRLCFHMFRLFLCCAAAHIVILFHVLDAFCECSFVVYTSTCFVTL